MRRLTRSGGSGHRLEDWLDEHYEEVYRTARLILVSSVDAEAATTQAFLRAWRFRGAISAGHGVRLWLLRAALHACSRQMRTADAGGPPAEGDRVLTALASLPAEERIVVVLRFWAGLSTVEAAAILGERPERVTARMEAAMAHLAGAPLAVVAGGSAMTVVDETRLEEMVREAGSGLETPPEGGALVLESLPRRDGRPRERYAKWGAVVAAMAVLAVIIAVVANGSGGSPKEASRGSASSASPAPQAPATAAGQGSSAGINSAAAPTAGVAALPDVVPQMPTRVVKTGTIALQVPFGHAGDTLSRISSQAATWQGFVSTSSIQDTSGAVTVRVPVGSFEAMVGFVQKLGTPTSVTTSGQDVTNSYVDLQARIGSLQAARTQFEQILARASSIGDILSVENQINDLQTQVEQLQGQLNVMTDQTSFSTLTVNVSEKPRPGVVVTPPKPSGGLSKAWDHARHSFVHGVEAVIAASGGIAVFLLFVGLVAVGGRYGWRATRRRLV